MTLIEAIWNECTSWNSGLRTKRQSLFTPPYRSRPKTTRRQ